MFITPENSAVLIDPKTLAYYMDPKTPAYYMDSRFVHLQRQIQAQFKLISIVIQNGIMIISVIERTQTLSRSIIDIQNGLLIISVIERSDGAMFPLSSVSLTNIRIPVV